MGTIVVEKEPDEMDLAFYRTLEGRSPAWAMRAIAGYSTRRVTDAFAADGRGPSLEQLNHQGLSHAHTDEERAAWTHGFTYPDTMAADAPPAQQPADPAFYTCERCRVTYRRDRVNWSDDKARAEQRELWGAQPEPDDAVVCDGCFKQLMAIARERGLL